MPLYVLATPIGNLSDLSPRAKDCLAKADVIAAEDTRVTRKLLQALQIPAARLVSYRGHDEDRRAGPLIDQVAQGLHVVLVSDAGTPCVSDPGVHLVRGCHDLGLPVFALAGPSAAIAALSVSGLAPLPCHILGFPPRKPGPLRQWLRVQLGLEGCLVLLEAPGRTAATVAAIAELVPEREICMARELTKLHEEVLLASARELSAELAGRDRLRGEVVLVVGPGDAPEAVTRSVGSGSLKEVAAVLAERWGVSRKLAYQRLLELDELSES